MSYETHPRRNLQTCIDGQHLRGALRLVRVHLTKTVFERTEAKRRRKEVVMKVLSGAMTGCALLSCCACEFLRMVFLSVHECSRAMVFLSVHE